MQLRRLAALERKKLQDEYRDILALIKELEELLRSPKKVLALIRQNLVDLKATYGDARRTQITEQARGALTVTDVLPDEETWVTVRRDGTVGRAALRLPAGTAAPQWVLPANTHCDLYLVSRRGQATRIGVHQLPDGAGNPHWDMGGLKRGDRIAAAFTARKPNGEPLEGYVVLATARGAVKRINLADLAAAAQANPIVIKLDADDDLVWAGTSSGGGGEIMLVTAGGQAIRFAEDEVRAMGLPAGGIAGIKLQANDRVVGGAVVSPEDAGLELATVTAAGFGRRSPLKEFPAKGRGTQGVAAKLATKSGEIVSAFLVAADDKLMFALSSEVAKSVAAKSLPSASRTNAGKVVLVMSPGEQVERAVLLPRNGIEPEPPAKRGGSTAAPAARARKPDAPAEKSPVKPRAKPAAAPASAAAKNTPPTADGEDIVVRRGKPAAMAAVSPPEDVVSRRGQPASIARPSGEPAPAGAAKTAKAKPPVTTSGQMMLVPDESASAAKPKTSAPPKTAAPPAVQPKAESAAKPAAGKASPAVKPAEAKSGSAAPPKGATKPAASKTTEAAKSAAKPAAKSKRVPEAEFEPKPKGAGTKPEKPGESDLRTTWSPSPTRTPEEPENKPPKGKK
jgi:DNA gyrase subunit A